MAFFEALFLKELILAVESDSFFAFEFSNVFCFKLMNVLIELDGDEKN